MAMEGRRWRSCRWLHDGNSAAAVGGVSGGVSKRAFKWGLVA